jgi:hypothetical protein
MAEAADEDVRSELSGEVKEDKQNDIEKAEKAATVAGSKKKGKKKKKDVKSSETGKLELDTKSRTIVVASFYIN